VKIAQLGDGSPSSCLGKRNCEFQPDPGHHQHYTVFRLPITLELNPRLGEQERNKSRKSAQETVLPLPLVSRDLMSRYNREELYERVWSLPMQRLAAAYGISDVGLAKVCRKLCIPLPGRGFWAKKSAGKTVRRRPPLPSVQVQAERARGRGHKGLPAAVADGPAAQMLDCGPGKAGADRRKEGAPIVGKSSLEKLRGKLMRRMKRAASPLPCGQVAGRRVV
jgi:hypothetical protein